MPLARLKTIVTSKDRVEPPELDPDSSGEWVSFGNICSLWFPCLGIESLEAETLPIP